MNPNAAAVVVRQYLPLQGGKPREGQGTEVRCTIYVRRKIRVSFQFKDAGWVIYIIFRGEGDVQSDGHEVGAGERLAV